jgi:hypothetical protein
MKTIGIGLVGLATAPVLIGNAQLSGDEEIFKTNEEILRQASQNFLKSCEASYRAAPKFGEFKINYKPTDYQQ